MKLQGKVLKAFNDKNTGKLYRPKDEYKDADVFEADENRYLELFHWGYVEKGKVVDKKDNLFNDKKEEK